MKREIQDYLITWEKRCYPKGIPDDAPKEIFDKVPSYKAIALCILKNDLKIIGVEQKPCLAYIALKRIEISNRPQTQVDQQLKIDFKPSTSGIAPGFPIS
jgi:hypothetical protein